jgi:hypothetical protein
MPTQTAAPRSEIEPLDAHARMEDAIRPVVVADGGLSNEAIGIVPADIALLPGHALPGHTKGTS